MTLQNILVTRRQVFSSKKILHKNEIEDFALQIVEIKFPCGQMLKLTESSGVFYSKKKSKRATSDIRETMEMFLLSCIHNLNFQLLEVREIFHEE